MATFETAVAQNSDLIRKPLRGSVLLGNYPDAAEIDTLVATGGGVTIPTGYTSVGWISEDGLTFANDVNVSDVRGWGASSFLRRDIQSQDKTLQFAALESSRLTMELRTSLDLSAANTVAASGEWSFDVPDRPPTKYWRVLCLGYDGDGDDRIWLARWFPRATVSDMDDEVWSDGDDPLTTNCTMSALVDDAVGVVERNFWFGPGVLGHAVSMGLVVGT